MSTLQRDKQNFSKQMSLFNGKAHFENAPAFRTIYEIRSLPERQQFDVETTNRINKLDINLRTFH